MRPGGTIAYFSMEIGVDLALPTYSGGLGILAGDTLKAAADLGLPMLGVTLLYRKGYFNQHIDEHGQQTERAVIWNPADKLEQLVQSVSLRVANRDIHVRAWRFIYQGARGQVPIYFLDTDLPANSPEDRAISHSLYGGDERMRLIQEIVLGIGGVLLIKALKIEPIVRYHMNEGHAALLLAALADDLQISDHDQLRKDLAKCCCFTTHTPLPAGHDRFDRSLIEELLPRHAALLFSLARDQDTLNFSHLALACSGYTNGVSVKHAEVSRRMFPGFQIDAITNGVHAPTWLNENLAKLLDRYCGGWRQDMQLIRRAISIPLEELWAAHTIAKRRLISFVNTHAGADFDPEILTLGFARRATGYKRMNLLFRDLDALRTMVLTQGPLQIVFGGKAHPRDLQGKDIIRQLFEFRRALAGSVRIVFIEDYSIERAQLLYAGCDAWLNTPIPPLEASGTSGMKAAMNAVPSISVLDGWWCEGWHEGVTGWAIGTPNDHERLEGNALDEYHARALVETLRERVLPTFYQRHTDYVAVMRSALALNGSFFTTQRMVQEYCLRAYTVSS